MAQPPHGTCNGEGCSSNNPWPIHHVQNRGSLHRLCTSCVLRTHPGSFCTNCFVLVEPTHSLPLVHCLSCPSVSHVSCLKTPETASGFVCPVCAATPSGFSFFPLEPRVIDSQSSKVLLAAAQLAAASMRRAVAAATAEAEKKVKDAVLVRKKGQEMLEKVLVGPVVMATPLAMVDAKEVVPLSQILPTEANDVVDSGKLALPNIESKDKNAMIVSAPTDIVLARNQDSPITSATRRVVFSGLP